MPFSTRSRVLAVRYMHTPRPYSEKWMFHNSSFIFSLAWGKGNEELHVTQLALLPSFSIWHADRHLRFPRAHSKCPQLRLH